MNQRWPKLATLALRIAVAAAGTASTLFSFWYAIPAWFGIGASHACLLCLKWAGMQAGRHANSAAHLQQLSKAAAWRLLLYDRHGLR